MHQQYVRAFTGAILLVALLFAPSFATLQAASRTLSESEIGAATVNLYCSVKLGNRTYSTTGSGVLISERGVVLTNAHVGQYFLLAESVKKNKANCSVRTGSPAKTQYEAQVLYISPKWIDSYAKAVKEKTNDKGTGERDFALLYITDAKKGTVPARFPSLSVADPSAIPLLEDGDPVTIAGYPAEGATFNEVRSGLTRVIDDSTVDSIRSYSRTSADILLLAPSTAAKGGVSGGPVVGSGGTVLGIATTVGGEKVKGLRSLRAITSVHIHQVIRADTGFTLAQILAENFSIRASITRLLLPTNTEKTLETTLRRVN